MYAPLNILQITGTTWQGHNPMVTESNVRASTWPMAAASGSPGLLPSSVPLPATRLAGCSRATPTATRSRPAGSSGSSGAVAATADPGRSAISFRPALSMECPDRQPAFPCLPSADSRRKGGILVFSGHKPLIIMMLSDQPLAFSKPGSGASSYAIGAFALGLPQFPLFTNSLISPISSFSSRPFKFAAAPADFFG